MASLRNLAALAAALAVTTAHAGLKIVTDTKRHGKDGTFTILVEGKNARIDMTRAGGSDLEGAFINDGDHQRMIVINAEKKEYHEITAEQMRQMKAKLDGAMAKMKEQMAKLPPEQRARMEQMMSRYNKAPEPVEETYTKAGGSKKVAGYSCELYDAMLEGKKVADVCFIPWSALPREREELKALADARSFWGTTGEPGPGGRMMKAWGMDIGLPAWRKTVRESDEDVSESTLRSISRAPVPAGSFEPPAGYAKKEIESKRGR